VSRNYRARAPMLLHNTHNSTEMRVPDVDAPTRETMVHGLLMPARNSRPSILDYA